jgi:hypothetical protein
MFGHSTSARAAVSLDFARTSLDPARRRTDADPAVHRYAIENVNLVPIAFDRVAVLAARSAARDSGNQSRASPGYQGRSPWFVGFCR